MTNLDNSPIPTPDDLRDPNLCAVAWCIAVAAFVLLAVGVFVVDQVVRAR
jgi:hypothetical protein